MRNCNSSKQHVIVMRSNMNLIPIGFQSPYCVQPHYKYFSVYYSR